jgi:NAD(P)H dehydrogenase (quinone)
VKASARKTLVVFAHPVETSFGGSLLEAVTVARRTRGDQVQVLDLYRAGFVPAMSRDDWRARNDPAHVPSTLPEHVAMLQWADSLVLVYPTWFGAQPAILKGWFDRLWVNGVAFSLKPDGSGITGRLRNIREIVVVTTHGSSKVSNALGGEPGKRLVKRGLRVLLHPLCRVRWVAFYGNDTATPQQRTVFVTRVTNQLGSSGLWPGRGRTTVSR